MSALPLLIITREGDTVRSQAVDAEISIGRGEGNVIRLEDRAVSRKHAIIRKTSEGVQIEKQSDFAPIRLNGVECTRALIRDGDVVDIGPFRVRLDAKKEPPKEISRDVEKLPPEAMEATVVLNESEMQRAEPLPTDFSSDTLDLGADGALLIDNGDANQGLGIAHPIEGDASGAEVGSEDPGTNIFNEPTAENGDGHIPDLNIDFGNLGGDSGSAELERTAPSFDENAATRVITSVVDACLEIDSGLANTEKLDLNKAEVFIGRGKECDLVLNDKKSSRKNTVISRIGNRYVLKDLGSSNGTFLNGSPIQEAELSADDVIRVGEVEIRFIALNPDYEKKKNRFLSVAAAEALAPSSFEGQPQGMGTPAGSMYGQMTGEHVAPAPVGRTGLGGIYDKYVKNFGTLKPVQKILVLLTAALVLSWFFEEELGLVEKPKSRTAVVKKTADGKPSLSADYDSLPPEKRTQIDDAIRRGTENIRTMNYDQALYEVQTFVFSTLPTYGPAKEIERYAQEGKRRKEAIAEEARKKEAARELKERILSLETQTRDFMSKRQYDQANETFGEILSVDPDNASVSEWKREIEAWMEEQTRIQQEKQVQEEINKRAWDTYNEGFELHKAGKFKEAIELYKKVPELGTDDPILLKKYMTMVNTCQDSIRDLRDPHLRKAKAFEQEGDLASAYKEYQFATEIDPTDAAGWAGMDRIRDVLTERAKILYTEAVIAESYSDFKTANVKFKEILKMAPDGSLYHQRATRKLQSYLNFKPEDEGL